MPRASGSPWSFLASSVVLRLNISAFSVPSSIALSSNDEKRGKPSVLICRIKSSDRCSESSFCGYDDVQSMNSSHVSVFQAISLKDFGSKIPFFMLFATRTTGD
ncbi:hypothetical protein HZ326_25283 [Fusarium oxysporum f. sp. albedinis]|nr:hypothetical protein HZ326_25283 [Fusarium oxysporum f. sp. albedinis]